MEKLENYKAILLNLTREQTGKDAVQIGKILSEVRGICPHGEWIKWVKDNTSISRTDAFQYIKSYELFGHTNIPEDLSKSILFSLTALKEIPTNLFDLVKNMTVRQVKSWVQSQTPSERPECHQNEKKVSGNDIVLPETKNDLQGISEPNKVQGISEQDYHILEWKYQQACSQIEKLEDELEELDKLQELKSMTKHYNDCDTCKTMENLPEGISYLVEVKLCKKRQFKNYKQATEYLQECNKGG